MPDNKPGNTEGSWNYVKIRYTLDLSDASKIEYVTYGHFAQDSIPLAVCPNICPAVDPECDAESEGQDPDGAKYPLPISVDSDTIIGYIGNSGHTTAPHLHIHVTTGADDTEVSGPTTGSYPLLFHSVLIQSREGDPDDSTFELDGHAMPNMKLTIPME